MLKEGWSTQREEEDSIVEFVNELFEELFAITHTEHRITSAYHPQVKYALMAVSQFM